MRTLALLLLCGMAVGQEAGIICNGPPCSCPKTDDGSEFYKTYCRSPHKLRGSIIDIDPPSFEGEPLDNPIPWQDAGSPTSAAGRTTMRVDTHGIVLCSHSGEAEKPCNNAELLQALGYPKPEPMDVPAVGGDSVAHDTCTDKRRVLLTSEDGTKHCILFPKE